jgi:hypothetical protein
MNKKEVVVQVFDARWDLVNDAVVTINGETASFDAAHIHYTMEFQQVDSVVVEVILDGYAGWTATKKVEFPYLLVEAYLGQKGQATFVSGQTRIPFQYDSTVFALYEKRGETRKKSIYKNLAKIIEEYELIEIEYGGTTSAAFKREGWSFFKKMNGLPFETGQDELLKRLQNLELFAAVGIPFNERFVFTDAVLVKTKFWTNEGFEAFLSEFHIVKYEEKPVKGEYIFHFESGMAIERHIEMLERLANDSMVTELYPVIEIIAGPKYGQ